LLSLQFVTKALEPLVKASQLPPLLHGFVAGLPGALFHLRDSRIGISCSLFPGLHLGFPLLQPFDRGQSLFPGLGSGCVHEPLPLAECFLCIVCFLASAVKLAPLFPEIILSRSQLLAAPFHIALQLLQLVPRTIQGFLPRTTLSLQL